MMAQVVPHIESTAELEPRASYRQRVVLVLSSKRQGAQEYALWGKKDTQSWEWKQ